MPWIPVLPRERLEQMTLDQVLAYQAARKKAEDDALSNPVACGWIMPSWQVVMDNWKQYPIHILLGGNRAGKSSLAARLAVWVACTIPEAEVRCYHVNDKRSVEDQQKFIWEAIPQKIKELPVTRGRYHSLQYSQKNGFADGVCIFPPLPGARRGGSIYFGNYRQYQQDDKVAEGFKAHFIWADEEMPQKMFETLQYRTTDFHGRIMLTFTTIDGWTPIIQDILGKTKTLERRVAKYLPTKNTLLPTLQESLSRPGCLIHYFWTEDNPFIDTQDFFTKIKGRPKDEILARAYGIPTKSVTSVFPGFNKEVNVIPHDQMPWIKNPEYKVTRYMACDPAGSKNFFMLWVAIDPAGTWWVYREWPDYDDWALPGNTVEGKPGPAQRGSKRGIKDYIELIKQCEGTETVFERLIDPRLGASEKQGLEGATTLISDFDDANMTFIPAPGVEIETGLQLINNLLAFDDSKPIDSLNAPKLYISDRCTNLIFAMSEYTAQGGKSEATKDPVDCLRYLCCANCDYIEQAAADWGNTGGY